MNEVPRIELQKTAAEMLRVTPRRLREMESDAPWWTADLRTEKGYDVVGIAVAQLSFSTDADAAMPAAERDALKARSLRAKTERDEFAKEVAEVEAWEARLRQQEKQRNILPADVYAEYSRELLGMVRSRLNDLPYKLSRQATPAQRPFVYVDPKKQKREKDAAPLQREVRKLVTELEEWLNDDPTRETSQ